MKSIRKYIGFIWKFNLIDFRMKSIHYHWKSIDFVRKYIDFLTKSIDFIRKLIVLKISECFWCVDEGFVVGGVVLHRTPSMGVIICLHCAQDAPESILVLSNTRCSPPFTRNISL